jgi:nucleoside-diphosphate-sugar epimerase
MPAPFETADPILVTGVDGFIGFTLARRLITGPSGSAPAHRRR